MVGNNFLNVEKWDWPDTLMNQEYGLIGEINLIF